MLIEKKSEQHSEKIAVRRWRKAVVIMFGMVGMLLLAGCATALGLYLAGNETALTNWLQQARVPLLFWRLMLYGIVAGMWFHRVRAALLRQSPSPGAVYRLEVLMVCLALLIEFTSYRWGM
ncbi:hypothetical protein [Serratia fonticola]|uniref:Uncharacterized protein n=1 Tax=Serratia fonticola TaxID=47917 RepID=A0AAW3WKG8_SERFO|nr:hypothetical protein [Serratia fonticola]MBC3211042.1 hypothetical protein [Serratia fonticola]NYA12024.1 hypothetical protein [Serratia fonticola]NYA31603.1 hypothetical protein [Serratia fonticola]